MNNEPELLQQESDHLKSRLRSRRGWLKSLVEREPDEISILLELLYKGTLAPIAYKEKRAFTSYEGTKYILPSDELERERLEKQHRIITQAFDNKLVLPPVILKKGDKVLDSATGGCNWLLNCMKNVPSSVEIYGIDIETRLFPAADCLPDNVHLSLNSVTNLPSKWNDTFTLINQRLLILALQNHEWVVALKELHRVLALKGWLQLCEVDPFIRKGGPVVDKINALRIALCDSKGLVVDIASQLPEILQNAGFVDVHVVCRSTPLGKWAGKYGEDGRDNIVSLWKGLKTPVMMAGGLGIVHSEEEFDDMLEDLERELDGSPGAQNPFFMIYAQKPE